MLDLQVRDEENTESREFGYGLCSSANLDIGRGVAEEEAICDLQEEDVGNRLAYGDLEVVSDLDE